MIMRSLSFIQIPHPRVSFYVNPRCFDCRCPKGFGFLYAFLFTCFLTAVNASGYTFFVAADGSATNPGTESAPFGSIVQARDHVRGLIADGLQQDVTVLVRGGRYVVRDPIRFTPEDTISDTHSVTYLAYPGEEPVISGGEVVSGWNKVEGIWKADLSGTDLEGLAFRELFVNGVRRKRARAPNEGFFRVQAPGEDRRTNFQYYEEDLLPYPDLSGAEVVYFHDWSTSRVRIDSMDIVANTLFFESPIGAAYSQITGISHFEPHPRYYIENHLALLDRPGEWYHNRETGVLHYWPFPEETLGDFTVIVPYADSLVEFTGDPESSQFVKNIHLKGLTFSHCAWNIPVMGYAGYQAGSFEIRPLKAGLDVYRDRIPAAVTLRWAEKCSVSHSRFTNLGGGAIRVERGSKNIQIYRNDIRDIGAGGIMVGEMKGVPFAERTTSGEWNLWWEDSLSYLVSNTTVVNNTIENCGVIFYDAVGIWVGIAEKTHVKRNQLRNLPYSGISVGWVWDNSVTPCVENIIEGNYISNVMRLLSDGAGIYTLGRQDGTVVRNNIIHSVSETNGRAGNNGLFLDQGTKGLVFENNILFSIMGNHCVRFNNSHQVNPNEFISNSLVPQEGFEAFGPAPPETVFTDNAVEDPETWVPPNPADLQIGLQPREVDENGIPMDWINEYAGLIVLHESSSPTSEKSLLFSAFISGVSPFSPEPGVRLSSFSGGVSAGFRFDTRLSQGIGYGPYERYYQIEKSDCLVDPDWRPVQGFDSIPATGDDVIFPFSLSSGNGFYRVRVWLEEN